jgi:hypothetical protein
MSDPVSTAKLLLKQRDEWKAKYEAEVKLLNWLEEWKVAESYTDDKLNYRHVCFSWAEGPMREAVRKAMENE